MGPADPSAAARPVSPERLARVRWRCRRGMLENDLVLARFLERRGAALTEAEVAALDVLLDLPDGELWNVLSGRAAAHPAAGPLLAAIAAS